MFTISLQRSVGYFHNEYIKHLNCLKTTIRITWLTVWGCGLGTGTLPAHADAPPAALVASASAHVQQALLAPLEPAVRATLTLQVRILGARGAALQDCPAGWVLGAVAPGSWQRLTLPLSCGAATGSVVARIHAQAPAWTLRSPASAGQILTAKDLTQTARRVHGVDELLPLEALLGQQLRRNAKAGASVRLQDLVRPVFARKGESVEIRASGADGVTVSVAGIASKTGYQGEQARVRNARSQQWVAGRWIAPRVLEASPLQPGSGGVKVEQESRD